jgi:hypothetical protein
MKTMLHRGIRFQPGLLALILAGGLLIPARVSAEVVKVEITGREVVSVPPELIHTEPYEVIKGTIYLEVDPDLPANRRIADLKLAPRNSRGRIEFSTDFELHKPVDAGRGNHRLMYFVNNRGNKLGNWHFNHEAGKNWLYSRGYSYLWCGWNCDVIESDRSLNIHVPVITENGRPVTGLIYSEIISFSDDVTYSQPLVWGGSLAYPPVTLDNTHATLTKRQYRAEEPITIPRDGWSFARLEKGQLIPDPGYLYIKEGFAPGWLYDLVYTGKNPKVTGLGLAAIRDVVSFFKHEKADRKGFVNPLAGVIDFAYAWGHSQSARLLNHFVWQNFNGDENGRMVFDGVMANCPGAGKGQFNSRFAQFTRHGSHHEDNLYPVDFFPFASVEQRDPVTGQEGDAFSEARKSGFMPKMMFINSSTDYWTRAASLLHTDVEGKRDIEIGGDVRIYAIAGRAHTDSRIGIVGRALLTALDEWVSLGTDPPASQIPTISDGTLVTLEEFKKDFPRIPGVIIPESFYQPYRLDPGPRWEKEGVADHVPPKTGPKYVCLVPQVDEDGREMAGIRLPEIEAPLATYTGWSMRDPSFSNSLRRNAGAVWPLPRTAEERRQNGDPRKSVLERYPSKKDYLFNVMKSLLSLKKKRLIVDEDFDNLLQEAAEQSLWPVNHKEMLVSIKEFSAMPAQVQRGDTIIFTVITEGKIEDVLSFRLIWREAPQAQITLNEDHKNSTENADEHVKTFTMEIGGGFPLGTFHFDLLAIDTNLNPVYLAGTTEKGKGELGSVTIEVK